MAAPAAKSTLIEFPATRHSRTSLPDWRVELNEKVRAIKARRSMEALVDEATSHRQAALAPPRIVEPAPVDDPPAEPANPIVAAALDRVRRASENAARVAHQAPAASAAAAHAAAPAPIREHAPRIIPLPPIAPAPSADDSAVAEAGRELFDPSALLDGLDDDLDLLDDGKPSGLLALGPAPHAVSASLALRAVASLVDLAVFCLVSVPFVATTYALDGDFRRPSVVALLASTLCLLAVFYLFSMLALSGRTVGMMLSRTHVVGADGMPPATRDLLVRVLATFVSLVPAGLGFLWAVVQRERCSWHDLMSGTRVVED